MHLRHAIDPKSAACFMGTDLHRCRFMTAQATRLAG
jgi:hypothetical protein